jgi:hypothetical protein
VCVCASACVRMRALPSFVVAAGWYRQLHAPRVGGHPLVIRQGGLLARETRVHVRVALDALLATLDPVSGVL